MEADGVSDTAANNFLIPMKLSPAARTAGWTSLIQGPYERCGRRCWNPICGSISLRETAPGVSMFRPALWGVAAVFFILSGRAMLTSQSRNEERQRSNSGCHTGPKAIPKKVKSDVRVFASALLVFAVGDLGFRRMHLQHPGLLKLKKIEDTPDASS